MLEPGVESRFKVFACATSCSPSRSRCPSSDASPRTSLLLVGRRRRRSSTCPRCLVIRWAFNAHKGERLLDAVSPLDWLENTGPVRSAAIVDDPKAQSIPTIVAWIPMPIPTSDSPWRWRACTPTSRSRSSGGRSGCSAEVSRSVGIDPSRAAWTSICYPPDAEWTDAGFRRPARCSSRRWRRIGGGTLPPKGDQSAIPKWAEGRVDVAGR